MSSQNKLQISVDETGEGVEIQQGIVGVDVNIVQESISVEVNHKSWFRITLSQIYHCFQGISTGCCKKVEKTEPPQTPVEKPIHPVEPMERN